MDNIILFPSDSKFLYIRDEIDEYIKKQNINNPKYAYYNFSKYGFCDINFEEYNVGLRLTIALEFVKSYSKDRKVNVYLFNPNISNVKEHIDFGKFMNDNIIEFNYIVKKSELFWPEDSENGWFNNSKTKMIKL